MNAGSRTAPEGPQLIALPATGTTIEAGEDQVGRVGKERDEQTTHYGCLVTQISQDAFLFNLKTVEISHLCLCCLHRSTDAT